MLYVLRGLSDLVNRACSLAIAASSEARKLLCIQISFEPCLQNCLVVSIDRFTPSKHDIGWGCKPQDDRMMVRERTKEDPTGLPFEWVLSA